MPGKLSLLLVDSSDDTRQLIEEILRGAGYEPDVTHIRRRSEMADAISRLAPQLDLVICESSPELDCISETIQALDCVDERPPLLVLSADHDTEAAVKAIKSGASDWIVIHHLHQRLLPAVDHLLSEREHAAQVRSALEESRRRYHDLAEALPQVVFEMDTSGRFLFVNQRGLNLFGYTRADLQQHPQVAAFLAPEDRARGAERLARVFAGEVLDDGAEYTAIVSDGTRIPIMIYSTPIVDQGEVVGARGILIDLRDVRRTQEQLHASEERYRRLVETMGDGLVTIDRSGIVTFANQAVADMLEMPLGEVIGRDFRDLFDADNAAIVEKQIERRFHEGSANSYEVEAQSASGKRLSLLITGTPLRDENDQVIASLGVITNITRRREREERRRLITARLSLQNRLNEMLNAGESVDGIIAAGADGLRDVLRAHHVHIFLRRAGDDGDELVMRYSNMPEETETAIFGGAVRDMGMVMPLRPETRAWEIYQTNEMLEITESELSRTAEDIDRWMRPETVVHGLEIIQRLGIRYLCMMPLVCGGTAIGHVTVSRGVNEPLNAMEKDLLRAFAGQMAVILDKARGEEEITRLNHLLQAIIDNAAVWFSVVDADDNLIIWNRAAAEISGYAREQIGSSRDLMRLLYPDHEDRHAAYKHVNAAFRDEGPDEFETSITRSDGRHRRMAWHLQSFLTTDRGRGLVVVGRDVTESRELQEHLQRVQRMDAVGTLAGGIAHDFNNVLTAIIGHAGLLAADPDDRNKTRWHARQIAQNSERASRLTRQLLAFSRKQPAQPQVVDLNRLIRDMEEMFRHIIPEDIDLQLDLSSDLGYTEIDPSQVEQIVMNVVLNARDAMPEGGQLRITTSNATLARDGLSELFDAAPGSYVTIQVADTGVGMDEETEAHIFEPFFTTKQVNGGTGLGLSTVYGLVRQNRGAITVYSEPGEGTLFRIYLPRTDMGDATDTAEADANREAVSGTETLLVVEDADNLRDLIGAMLRSLGYTVHTASDGHQALEIERTHRDEIALVVTDVVMPEISGTELADRLLELAPELRVLFISGYPNDRAISAGRHDRRFAFLQKPFSAVELGRAIREMLDS